MTLVKANSRDTRSNKAKQSRREMKLIKDQVRSKDIMVEKIWSENNQADFSHKMPLWQHVQTWGEMNGGSIYLVPIPALCISGRVFGSGYTRKHVLSISGRLLGLVYWKACFEQVSLE